MTKPTPVWLPAALLVLAIAAAYANTFSAPFVFDDVGAVTQNPSIERLSTALAPPTGLSVTGRPLLSFSLALNYALSGRAVWSYHAVNIALHALSALTLLGVLRRALAIADPRLSPHLATVTAFLWALHPLQTAAVTYVMQRSEELVSLAVLLTLYCFVRGIDCHPLDDKPPAAGRAWWLVASVAACLSGMAAKEVMVAAPLLVLLFDRVFITGSIRAALRLRPRYYTALASTWLLLAGLALGTGNRAGSAGFDAGVPWSGYALTQLYAIAHYLRLAFWPSPLVFDYGTALVRDPSLVVPAGLLVATLLAATAVAFRRWPAVGFCSVWFFALLAPSSSIVPIATQTLAEHRIYLALAAPLLLASLALHRWFGRRALLVGGLAALLFGGLTFARNTDYRSEVALWRDTAAKVPSNPRAHYNLGLAELDAGDRSAAIASLSTALTLDPAHAGAQDHLAQALAAAGRIAEALPHFARAAELRPDSALAQANFANALVQSGRAIDALPHLETAVRLAPASAEIQFALGNCLAQLGRPADAVAHFTTAIQLAPTHAAAHYNLGNALAQVGRYPEALAQFDEAARLDPADASARNNAARLRVYLASGGAPP